MEAPNPLSNPYAPPAAPIPVATTGASSYVDERRNVLLLILLSIVTLGLYPAIWYWRRTPFLDSLASEYKMRPITLIYLIVSVAYLAIRIAIQVTGFEPNPTRPLQLGVGIFGLVVAFRVARVLRSDFARTGRFISMSGVGIFFFGSLYLQHVINEAGDAPPRA